MSEKVIMKVRPEVTSPLKILDEFRLAARAQGWCEEHIEQITVQALEYDTEHLVEVIKEHTEEPTGK